MKPFETSGSVGADGRVHVDGTAPRELWNSRISLRVIPAAAANASAAMLPWAEFLRAFSGSIPDFPDVERAGVEEFEDRDEL